MKMRLLFSLLSFLLLSQAFAQPNGKKLLLEKITSAGCPSCPNGDLILHDLVAADSNLIPVAIHLNDPGHTDRMHTPDGDSILADYLWAHPTMMVDRYKFPGIQYVAGTIASWNSMISAREAMPMIGTIGGSTAYNANDRSLQIHLDGTILWDLTWDLRVNAYVVENQVTGVGLGYDQLNGNNLTQGHPLQGLGDPIVGYVHNWVLRDMLGGHRGMPGIPSPVGAGFPYAYDFSTTLDTAIDASQAYIILVLQRWDSDPNQREVLNVAKLGLNGSVLAGLEPPQAQSWISIWPNPTSDRVHVQLGETADWSLQVHDMQGRTVLKETFVGDQIEFSTSMLPAGMYLVHAQSPGKAARTQKLSIR